MGEWRFHGPNPIVGYTVGLLLEQPLSASIISQISGLHGHFKRELPRRTEQQAITFQVGAQPIASPRPELGGVVFDHLFPDGRARYALAVNQGVITYMVAEYSRWIEFWPVAERLLKDVMTVALTAVPVRGFLLTANNRFTWSSGDAPVVGELIRRDPPYVAPHILASSAPSHSIHNYTVRQETPAGERTDAIICMLGKGGEEAFIDLNFHLQLRLDAPVTDIVSLFGSTQSQTPPLLEDTLDALHETNKKLLRETIRDSTVTGIPGLLATC